MPWFSPFSRDSYYAVHFASFFAIKKNLQNTFNFVFITFRLTSLTFLTYLFLNIPTYEA